ncbi:MAG: GIY-YIG nuclease family protein [Candidatus Paceibacterota bacterium]
MRSMFYTYFLQSENYDETYIGFTSDLKNRVREHNQGLTPSTKRYRPWKLVYYEACVNEKDAKRREGYLKTTQGSRMLKRRLKEYFYELKSNK